MCVRLNICLVLIQSKSLVINYIQNYVSRHISFNGLDIKKKIEKFKVCVKKCHFSWFLSGIHVERTHYRPMLMGSSAIAISSVGALLPFFFFEYHMNIRKAYRLMPNTNQAK